MKKTLVIVFIALLYHCQGMAQSNSGEALAGSIAQKMKDSLALTSMQKDSIYAINLRLLEQKTTVRQQYTDSIALQYQLQRVERLRDSLYRPVLGEDKYPLYKIKKRNLLTAN